MTPRRIEHLAAVVTEHATALMAAEGVDADGSRTTEIVREIVAATGYCERHVWRTVARFRETGALPSRERFQLTHEHAEEVVTRRGAVGTAYRVLRRRGVELPSESTFRRAALDHFGKQALMAFEDGAGGMRDARTYLAAEEQPRNGRWEMDHSHLPLRVTTEDGGEPVEIWLTVALDAGTRFVRGWTLTIARANEQSVIDTLLMALRGTRAPDGSTVRGKPVKVVWDRGAEFLGNRVTDFCDAVKVQVEPTAAYRPEHKGKMERFFRSLKAECIDGLPGLTRGPRTLTGKAYNEGETVAFEDVWAAVAAYVDHYNFERGHERLGGRTPWDAWRDDDTPLQLPPSTALHAALRREPKPRKVQKTGVHFRNRVYKAAELSGYFGLQVEVRYLPGDLDTIEIFKDGQHVCTALEETSMSPAERAEFFSERRSQEARISRARRLHAGTKAAQPVTTTGTVRGAGAAYSELLQRGLDCLQELQTSGTSASPQQGRLPL